MKNSEYILKTIKLIRMVFGMVVFSVLLQSCAQKIDGTTVEEKLQLLILEKAMRAELYLAAAQQAESEGLVAESVYLNEIAKAETDHVLQMSALLVKSSKKTKSNLKRLIKLEKDAWKIDYPNIIQMAREQNHPDIVYVLEKIQKDHERHLSGMKGLSKNKK